MYSSDFPISSFPARPLRTGEGPASSSPPANLAPVAAASSVRATGAISPRPFKHGPLPVKRDFGTQYRLADGADLAARLEEIEKRLSIAEVPIPEPTIVVRSLGDERRREIYNAIMRAAELDLIAPTYAELADRLETAATHVNRYVSDLVDTGLLRRHGNQGQRYYEVVATGKFTRCPPNRGLQAASRTLAKRRAETTNRKGTQ